MATAVIGSKFDQTDSQITRNRGGRALVAIGSLVATPFATTAVATGLLNYFNLPLPNLLGLGLGLMGAYYVGYDWLWPRLTVIVDQASGLVTIDQLQSLFKGLKVNVSYGPGRHFKYPWEKPTEEGNLDLTEHGDEFTFEAVAKSGGTIKGKYEVRLRGDITMMPRFLAGFQAAAGEFGGIVKKDILAWVAERPLLDALGQQAELHRLLQSKYAHGTEEITEFEGRFGVIVGDITVTEFLPTADLQTTMAGEAEFDLISKIVSKAFGKENIEQVQQGVANNEYSQSTVDRRWNQAMVITKNMDGKQLTETDFRLDVSGLKDIDPEFVRAIASLGPVLSKFFRSSNRTQPKSPKS